ncbi:putative MFS transporter [Cercophora samala]|uniref:MFS transporter n=1 Tax=Cercophora samala TaxID=330535 RepID=A0AA39ZFG5_9PEZI|nr:putative MFS transporter [Cercophora samala]
MTDSSPPPASTPDTSSRSSSEKPPIPDQPLSSRDLEKTSETTSPNPTDLYGPAPDGGTRAWFVALGAACIFFSCLGVVNSFGVFLQYYGNHQLSSYTPDQIAWIGSLTACIQFLFGGISGPVFDRYGTWVIRLGAILYVLAIMMTSLCQEYYQFMLAQGVLTGLASAMIQVPAFAVVSQYFDKKRAAALGLVVSGSSIGGIVFPIALGKMLNDTTLGFGWSVRIMGFIVAPMMGFCCFSLKARLPPRQTQFFLWSAFTELRFLGLVVAGFFVLLGMFTPLFFLPSYAVSKGMDKILASYLLAIVNGASTFGRILPGILADKYGKLNIYGFGSLATGIVVVCLTKATTTAGLVVYSVFIGLTSGTIVSANSAAFSTCTTNPQNIGTYIGMGLAIGSIAILVGPPVNGVLMDKYGGYLEASLFSGIMCLAGGVVILATKLTTPEGLWGNV